MKSPHPNPLLEKEREKIVVICQNIRSAFNVGSIFRTADGAGVTKIILGGYSAHPPHPKITKTALSAEKFIPFERVWQTWRAVEILKKKGYYIVALEQNQKAISIFKFEPKYPLALIVGNEVKGLSNEILKHCDQVVFIPMKGKKESLNVSVAFGIAIYSKIELENIEQADVLIYAVTGELVYRKNGVTNQLLIQKEDLPKSGTYLVGIRSKEYGNQMQKLVVH